MEFSRTKMERRPAHPKGNSAPEMYYGCCTWGQVMVTRLGTPQIVPGFNGFNTCRMCIRIILDQLCGRSALRETADFQIAISCAIVLVWALVMGDACWFGTLVGVLASTHQNNHHAPRKKNAFTFLLRTLFFYPSSYG